MYRFSQFREQMNWGVQGRSRIGLRVGERIFFLLLRPSVLSHLLPQTEGTVVLGESGS